MLIKILGRIMIAYDLMCSNGHVFECWFKDSASFEEQKAAGIINCPICDDIDVIKVFSPFVIKKREEKKKGEVGQEQALKVIQDFLDKHFEDVGSDFAKEALKIHYGESEKRNIKGTATPEEEVLLKEEGVKYFKVPIIKRYLS
jgi:hypothetical protein